MTWCSENSTFPGFVLASSAIHCRFVDRFARFIVPSLFPGNGSLSRRLPSLFRVPVSPVPRSPRYYEGATTSHSRIRARLLVRFRSPRDSSSRSCLALALLEARSSLPGPGLLLLPATLLRLLSRGREWDLSGLQTFHPVPLLCSRTPVESPCPRQ